MTPDDLARGGSEHAHQRALFAWAQMAETYGFEAAWQPDCYGSKAVAESYVVSGRDKPVPVLDLLFAIPNGGERNKAVASKLKAEGVKSGVPDICLPVACGQYHALFIELKKVGGNVSPSQKDWANKLWSQGNLVLTCIGWRNAASALEAYIRKGGYHG